MLVGCTNTANNTIFVKYESEMVVIGWMQIDSAGTVKSRRVGLSDEFGRKSLLVASRWSFIHTFQLLMHLQISDLDSPIYSLIY